MGSVSDVMPRAPGFHTSRAGQRPTESRPAWWQWVIAGALLAGVVAVILVSFYPGTMNGDSFVVLQQTKLGEPDAFYAPVLVWIWHPFFRLGMGPGWSLLLQLLLFVGAAFALLRRAFSPIAAAAVVCIIALSPQLFGQLALIGRNSWFLVLLVACCACVNEALWSRERRRAAWSAGAIACAFFALDARPNAAAAVFVPLSLLAGLWLARRLTARRRTLVVASLVAGIVATLVLYEADSLAARATGAANLSNISQLYVYDLAGMSRIDGRDYFPRSVYPSGTLQSIDQLSNGASILELISGTHPPIVLSNANNAILKHRWEHEILSHPVTYLRARLQLTGWTLGIGHDQLLVDLTGVPPNPYGYSTKFTGANRVANDYENAFVTPLDSGGALFAPWIYLLICLAAVTAVAARPSRQRVIIGVLGLAVLTYQLGLVFAATSVNYRYEAPCMALTGIVIALGLRELWQVARPRRVSQVSPTAQIA